MELSSTPGQRLAIQIGPDKRLISNTEKPGLFITYAGVGLDFLAYTVIDQSCVKLAVDELQLALDALSQTLGTDGSIVDLP